MLTLLWQAFTPLTRDPSQVIRVFDLALVSKIMVLILVLLYVIFAVRVWVQVRRLERWLSFVRGYWFSLWALLHFILALLGLGLASLIL